MTDAQQDLPASHARASRAIPLLMAIACVALIAVGAYLTPDPRGRGTHQQLGLPPCISEHYLGFPCPLCGMTTAFALMADAQPASAFQTQPAGALFFIVTVCVGAASFATALFGFNPKHVSQLLSSRATTIGILAIVAVGWIYKIVTF